MSSVRYQITPVPTGTSTGPLDGRSAMIHVGDGQVFALLKDTSSKQTTMVSLDSGETWEEDGASEYPVPAFNAKTLIWDPANERLVMVRVVSGLVQWRYRTDVGTWSALQQQDSAASDSLASIIDARVGTDGNIRAVLFTTTAGTHHLWYWEDDTTEVQETITTDGGSYGTSGFTNAYLVLDNANVPHVIFGGINSSARSNLDTFWHTYRTGAASWSTPVAIKTDVADDHATGIDCRPVIDGDGNIHVAFVAKDGSGTNRLWHAKWNGSSWSDNEVDAEWEPRNTNSVAGGVDQQGIFYICTNGEVDSVSLNKSQVFTWYVLPDQSTYTREQVEGNARDIGSATSFTWSSGADMQEDSTLIPRLGGFFYGYGDWDSGTGAYWWVSLADPPPITWDLPEDPFTCTAEPTRSSIAFDDEGSSEATLSLVPDLALAIENRFETLEMRTERGYVVTQAQQPSTRRVWELHFIHRDATDRDTLLTMLGTLENGRGAFTFTEPISGDSIKAHIRAGSVSKEKLNPGVYSLSFEAEELLT